jgi:hypothetical protein
VTVHRDVVEEDETRIAGNVGALVATINSLLIVSASDGLKSGVNRLPAAIGVGVTPTILIQFAALPGLWAAAEQPRKITLRLPDWSRR